MDLPVKLHERVDGPLVGLVGRCPSHRPSQLHHQGNDHAPHGQLGGIADAHRGDQPDDHVSVTNRHRDQQRPLLRVIVDRSLASRHLHAGTCGPELQRVQIVTLDGPALGNRGPVEHPIRGDLRRQPPPWRSTAGHQAEPVTIKPAHLHDVEPELGQGIAHRRMHDLGIEVRCREQLGDPSGVPLGHRAKLRLTLHPGVQRCAGA